MSAPPPPPPPREASAAAALVAGLGAEGAELALPAPSLFHENNKYSHRRPRLVCARRLPILRPRPFTRRGAGSRGRDRARSRQSLRANQSPLETEGGTRWGRSPWMSLSLSCPGADAGAGAERDARRIPLRASSPQPSPARGPEMSTVLIFKITPSIPPPTREDPKAAGKGERGGEGVDRRRNMAGKELSGAGCLPSAGPTRESAARPPPTRSTESGTASRGSWFPSTAPKRVPVRIHGRWQVSRHTLSFRGCSK